MSVDYRGYRVYKNPPANQGPTELFALNILEGYDLKGMKHNSADYIHTSIEAVKLALADREKYLGDADFVPIPFDGHPQPLPWPHPRQPRATTPGPTRRATRCGARHEDQGERRSSHPRLLELRTSALVHASPSSVAEIDPRRRGPPRRA